MAFTSGDSGANSKDSPYLFIDLYTHEEGYVRFYKRPGNMVRNKGDVWRWDMKVFKFKKRCITKEMIHKVVIHNGGNDGWKISSVVTILRNGKQFAILTADMELNKWIDGNSKHPHQLTLTKVK